MNSSPDASPPDRQHAVVRQLSLKSADSDEVATPADIKQVSWFQY